MAALTTRIGSQRPRVSWVPPCTSNAQGEDAVELAASAGLELDPWEAWVLKQSMGTLPGGQWSAFEVGLLVPRQNGKNAILEARELAGLFLLDELLLIHTAHEFKTCEEHFLRVQGLVESTPDLARLVKKIATSHGGEGIELFPTPTIIMGSDSGSVRRGMASRRLRFLARSRSSARGFTADFLCYDEALILSAETVGASMPTMTARPNPQVWYTSSEGRADAFQLARVRRRGLKGNDPNLMWAEWSAELCTQDCDRGCTRHDDPNDPDTWAKANPGLGIRISEEQLQKFRNAMDDDTFAAAHLAVSEWPADDDGWTVISENSWDACASGLDINDPAGRPARPVVFAVEVAEGGASACIAVAGIREDGKTVGEIPAGDARPGTDWVIPRLIELKRQYKPAAIVIDPNGPASALIDEAERPPARLTIIKPTTREVAQAYGLFIIAVRDRTFVHLGHEQPNLRSAVANAVDRDTGDGNHAWARKSARVDLSPLVAVTLAVWAHGKYGRRKYDPLASVPG